ncbi:BspA family leucine-rich repeat surface protein, partial [Candidatus Saccharibacteria bacterium]|nr:BspA family leucine-rich repeat surface protein [Candidatus Saccharibacteria bacterium]
MFKRVFAASIVSAGILAAFCGGNVFAFYSSEPYTPGEKKNFYSGDIDVCIYKIGGYTGDTIIANVSDGNFNTQLSFDSFSEDEKCMHVFVPSGGGTNYVSYYTPMGLSNLNLDKESLGSTRKIKLNLEDSTTLNKYISSNGAFNNRIGASKIEIQFDANGGTGTMPAMTNLDPNTSFTLDSNSLTRTDYKFVGWNTKADGAGTSYTDGETITLTKGGIVRLYAQWVQATATLKTGTNVNAALKTLAKGSSVSFTTTDTLIKNLSFVDTLPSTVDENTPRVNIALDGEIPVYAYWEANDEAIYINTEADKIYANQNSSYIFYDMRALTSLTLPDSFNTSKVTDMSRMFRDMRSLTSLALPTSFDTSNVTNMSDMFGGMYALSSLTLPSSFNTSNVTNMSWMFSGVQSLTSLTLPDSFDTSKVTDMNHMFS